MKKLFTWIQQPWIEQDGGAIHRIKTETNSRFVYLYLGIPVLVSSFGCLLTYREIKRHTLFIGNEADKRI